MGYDERYAKASQVSEEARSAAAQQDARRAMQAVEQTAPYIQFFDANLLDAWPPDAQSYFRQGGRSMSLDIYKKGVKTSEIEYSGTENSWVTQEKRTQVAALRKTKSYIASPSNQPLFVTQRL